MTVPLFPPDNPINFPRRAQVTNTWSCGRTEAREIDHTVTVSHFVNPTQGVLMTPQRLAARVCASFVIASGRATRTGEAPPLHTLPTPPPVDAHLRLETRLPHDALASSWYSQYPVISTLKVYRTSCTNTCPKNDVRASENDLQEPKSPR